MGYLMAGALSGIGKEYVKQSGEERQNKFQELRDNRLAALTTKENIRSEGVSAEAAVLDREHRSTESAADRKQREDTAAANRASQEKMSQAEIDAKGPPTQTTPAGSSSGHFEKNAEGNWVYVEDVNQPKTFAPSAASNDWNKWLQESVEIRGAGGKGVSRISREKLFEEWEGQAYLTDTDDLGNKTIVRNESIPAWDVYYNQRVTQDYMVAPTDPVLQRSNPMEMFIMLQSTPEFKQEGGREKAIESIQKRHPWWSPPKLKEKKKGSNTYEEPGTGALSGKASDSATAGKGMLSQVPDQAAEAAAATAQPEGQGQIFESSRDIQSQISLLTRQLGAIGGRHDKQGNEEARRASIKQQIQQYEKLLPRVLEQEAAREKVGPSAAVGNRPQAQPQPIQVATRP